MTLPHERRFEFDVQGFVRLRGALAASEVGRYLRWVEAAEGADVGGLVSEHQDRLINRPVSRIIDVDPRFACFLDHPAVIDYLSDFLGAGYKHIDNGSTTPTRDTRVDLGTGESEPTRPAMW